MTSNFLFQKIELEDTTLEELVHYGHKAINFLRDRKNTHFFNVVTRLFPITKIKDLEVLQFSIVQAMPNKIGVIHSDMTYIPGSNRKASLALNIPLENCAGSFTNFYKELHPPVIGQLPNGGVKYNYYEASSVEKLGHTNLVGPTIIRIDIPHSVDNPTDNVRSALTIRFYEDPWHWLSKENML